MPENEDAVAVYSFVRSQAVYVGMDGMAVDLDFKAVEFIMNLMEIENKADCFHKVHRVWHHMAVMDNVKRKIKK